MVILEKVQEQVTEYAKTEVKKQKALEMAQLREKIGRGQAWETKSQTKFTAPDGENFDSEAAYKKYMYEKFYSFKEKVGETLVRKSGEIRGQSFDLADLNQCEVQLLDATGQVFADDLVNCKVYVGACGSDVFVRGCTDCTFTIACKQLRMRDCSNCKIYLYSATRPALETSHHIQLAPFNGAYPRQGSHFRQAGLDPTNNQWDQVHDFSRSNEDLPKPHWRKLPEVEWQPWEISFAGLNVKPENPVSRESNALWFTKTVGSSPIMGIKKKAGLKKSKSLFDKIGPRLK